MEPEDYFTNCWTTLFPGAARPWPHIAAAYRGRAYHNLDHLREMLGHLPAAPPLGAGGLTSPAPAAAPLQHPALFGLALIYHDVVYTAGRSDNEKRSADMLAKQLLAAGGTTHQATYCRRLIMATKTHTPSSEDRDNSEALLVDLDLAVLARPATGYDGYTAAIRHEFRRFPGFLYRRGRRKALLHLLQLPRIYQTQVFHDRWEIVARQNIARELSALS